MDSLPPDFAATVASLHRVAEEIVAPARKPDNEIALEVTAGGFGTPEFDFGEARHRVRVEGTELVHEVDGEERRAPLTSFAAAATVVAELLPGGADLGEEPLAVDPAAAAALAEWYRFADEVLRELASSAGDGAPASSGAAAPILWPEHFDVAIELGEEAAGERATYGFSPGDENHPEPYVYVGPWGEVAGELWQARGFKGAELGYAEILAAADQRAATLEFFALRRQALRLDPA